jgi:phosphatidylserine decarboxylase
MRFHKEGRWIILITVTIVAIINYLFYLNLPNWTWLSGIATSGLLIFVLQFFRNPVRTIEEINDQIVYAPADGKVVVIEKTNESEYFKDERIQVSIFMSPLNVHVNRIPFSGKIDYYKYHPGKYLVAWHPKSSTENERTTTVLSNGKSAVLIRQIAGAMARRIISYMAKGLSVQQGQDMGFIRFGSRVDVFLPLDADIQVEIGEVTKGNKTIIAKLS